MAKTPRIDPDRIAAKLGVSLPARLKRFYAKELAEYDGWFTPAPTYDGRLKVRFVSPTSDLLASRGRPTIPELWPLCKLGSEEAQFFVVDTRKAKCPVLMWEHETDLFTPCFASLDAFVGALASRKDTEVPAGKPSKAKAIAGTPGESKRGSATDGLPPLVPRPHRGDPYDRYLPSRSAFGVWTSLEDDDKGFCTVQPAAFHRELYRLRMSGTPAPREWVGGPIPFAMSSLYPHCSGLADTWELAGPVIVSRRLRAFIEQRAPDDKVQFLPAVILGHNKRPVDEEYFLVHAPTFDALDLERSEYGSVEDGEVRRCKKIVLRSPPPSALLFTVKGMSGRVTLVAASLARAILDEGFLGPAFRELGNPAGPSW